MNGWILQQKGFLPVVVLVCLLCFKVTPLRCNLGVFIYWSVLNLMVHPWTGIIIHTRETGADNPHWKQLLTAIPTSRLLLALTTERENPGYTQNSAPPPTCRHRTGEGRDP